MPNLRDRGAYGNAAWDWSILDGCFGATRIRPSDIDGAIEKNRHFLFLEAKPPNGYAGTGQAILLQRQSEQPNTTVIIVWGEREEPQKMQVMCGGKVYPPKPADKETFRAAVRDWYQEACNG